MNNNFEIILENLEKGDKVVLSNTEKFLNETVLNQSLRWSKINIINHKEAFVNRWLEKIFQKNYGKILKILNLSNKPLVIES